MGILGVTLPYSETVAHVSYGIITIKVSRNTEENVLFLAEICNVFYLSGTLSR